MSDDILVPAKPKRVVTLLYKDGSYAFRLPYLNGYSASRHGGDEYRLVRADGSFTELKEYKPYSTTGVPVVELWRQQSVQTGMVREVEGVRETMALADYRARVVELGPKIEVKIDGETELRHETLAEELAYKQFRNGWRAEYAQEWQLAETIEFEVQEDQVWDNPYVIPCRHVGEDFGSKFAEYRRCDFLKEHFTKIMKDFGYVDESDGGLFKQTKAPRHFTAKFWSHKNELDLRIGSHVIYQARAALVFRDTVEVCTTKYEADKAWLEKDVAVHLSSLTTVVTAASLKLKLQRALALASEVSPMKASWDAKKALTNYLVAEIAKCDDLELLTQEGDNAPALSPKAG